MKEKDEAWLAVGAASHLPSTQDAGSAPDLPRALGHCSSLMLSASWQRAGVSLQRWEVGTDKEQGEHRAGCLGWQERGQDGTWH